MFLFSRFMAAESETTRAVGRVTHPARHRGTSDVGIGPCGQRLSALMINGNPPVGSVRGTGSLTSSHGLKWGNGFAPIWALKLDISVCKTHSLSYTQRQKAIYPILSQLTQIPAWRSLFSSMDFKLSLRQPVQTRCLALKSVNVADTSPPGIFCASLTPCHDLLVPEMAVSCQPLPLFPRVSVGMDAPL